MYIDNSQNDKYNNKYENEMIIFRSSKNYIFCDNLFLQTMNWLSDLYHEVRKVPYGNDESAALQSSGQGEW
jgi:hypothetical protein